MPGGSTSNTHVVMPVPAGTPVAAGTISATGDAGLDGADVPYSLLADATAPGTPVPLSQIALDGADAVGTHAGTQAGSTTVGRGIRGWLSTIAGLLQGGLAKVTLVDGAQHPISTTYPLATLPAVAQCGSAALSSVAASSTSVSLLGANAGRKGVLGFNDSIYACYIAFASSASQSTFTEKVPPGGSWVMDAPPYTGALSIMWDGVNGAFRLTEMT